LIPERILTGKKLVRRIQNLSGPLPAGFWGKKREVVWRSNAGHYGSISKRDAGEEWG